MSRSLWRGLNGIFPVLKPHGVTSAQLLNNIKEKLTEEFCSGDKSTIKMGHGGILDSTATGVLVVGIGKDCKNLKFFLNSEKCYFVRGQLGVATDTHNEIGQIMMERRYDHVTENMLQERLKDFEGRIKQTPPLYSALKKDGKRYSDLAREGIDIEIQPRFVHCYELKLSEFNPPYFALTVSCGPGFYIRSLIHDLGQVVGSCAHVRELQRTKQGPFHIKDALSENQWNVEHISWCIDKWRGKLKKYFLSADKWYYGKRMKIKLHS
ncbi:pseudouridylate synthase TRUB1-like isoform X1 [Palaemon carinicauda]|uniref:pseudouridylate synthase TRUB1-like isoform X1 n=2 Tax=Palaemon carinicauda TaxID=392227 RepID=UPI0035B59F94